MIQTKKELKEVLKLEKAFYCPNRIDSFLSLLSLNEKGMIWKYQKRLRKQEYYFNSHKKIRYVTYKFLTNHLGRKYGFSIAVNCFDSGLHIMHLGSILVNSQSRIGQNCLIHINTALVSTSGKQESPILGNNIKIGIGATLIGNIILADNIAIGAGSVVTHSFHEQGVTIAGNPAKIISRKGEL